jgi:hypothetical protein
MSINISTANAMTTTGAAFLFASIIDWLPWVLGVTVGISAIVLNIIAIQTKRHETSAAIFSKRRDELLIKKLEEDE